MPANLLLIGPPCNFEYRPFVGPKKLGAFQRDFFQGVCGAHSDDRIFARQSLNQDAEERGPGKHLGRNFVSMADAAAVTARKFFEYAMGHFSGNHKT